MAIIRVKICGITREEDARAAVMSGAWAVGFMFYKKSPRFIPPRRARTIIRSLPPFVTPVGVFVNQSETEVKRIAGCCGLRTLQFHGDESPGFCRRFLSYRLIKAFRIADHIPVGPMERYPAAAFLLDAYQPGLYGGTGRSFNWLLGKDLRHIKKPIILSGGLKAGNARQALRHMRPYALDVSSGVEQKPGIKDPQKIKRFFRAVNKA